MTRYTKAIVAVIGFATAFVFNTWGADFGLPADWPQAATATLTPFFVWLLPNSA